MILFSRFMETIGEEEEENNQINPQDPNIAKKQMIRKIVSEEKEEGETSIPAILVHIIN